MTLENLGDGLSGGQSWPASPCSLSPGFQSTPESTCRLRGTLASPFYSKRKRDPAGTCVIEGSLHPSRAGFHVHHTHSLAVDNEEKSQRSTLSGHLRMSLLAYLAGLISVRDRNEKTPECVLR